MTSSTVKYFPKNSTGEVKMVPFESIKSVETAQDIIISKQNKNQKWVLIPRLFNSTTTGMFTFNDNGTETSDDDISRLFTFFYDQDGNKFQPTNFLCVAQDQDNALWMGTTDLKQLYKIHHNGYYTSEWMQKLWGNGESYRDWETDRKSTRLNSSHITRSRMPSSA